MRHARVLTVANADILPVTATVLLPVTSAAAEGELSVIPVTSDATAADHVCVKGVAMRRTC